MSSGRAGIGYTSQIQKELIEEISVITTDLTSNMKTWHKPSANTAFWSNILDYDHVVYDCRPDSKIYVLFQNKSNSYKPANSGKEQFIKIVGNRSTKKVFDKNW